MGLPMGLRIDLFFVCPMNLQGILLRVRYQMGVLKRPALGGLFSFEDCQRCQPSPPSTMSMLSTSSAVNHVNRVNDVNDVRKTRRRRRRTPRTAAAGCVTAEPPPKADEQLNAAEGGGGWCFDVIDAVDVIDVTDSGRS